MFVKRTTGAPCCTARLPGAFYDADVWLIRFSIARLHRHK